MSRERYDWLWRRGSREAVAAALTKIEDPGERGEFYVRAVEVTQRWRPALVRFLCEAYVEEFYAQPTPFGPGVMPDGGVLAVLTRIYEQEGRFDLAEWVCEIALANDATAAGLEGGFAGWIERVRQKRVVLGTPELQA